MTETASPAPIRTLDVINQEYNALCGQLGHVTFTKHVTLIIQQDELSAQAEVLKSKMAALTKEAAALPKEQK